MPIEISHPVRGLDQVAFHLVDEVVTGLSFGIHNDGFVEGQGASR